MGIAGFTQSEKVVLEKYFHDIKELFLTPKFKGIDDSLSAAETRLKSEIGEMQAKISSMKAAGVTFLDQKTLDELFNSVRAKFEEEQQKLEQTIAEFQKACSEYEAKHKELLEREEEIIKQECQADADFASKHDRLLAPIRRLQTALEEQQKLLMSMQDENNTAFMQREAQLVEDFKTLSLQQKTAFEDAQKKLLSERQELAAREVAVSQREEAVAVRMTEVREGLAQERSQMMADIAVLQNGIDEQKADLARREKELLQERTQLETEKGKLQRRIDTVYEKECQAEEGFADKRAEMQADIEKLRQSCLAHIHEEEAQASARREQLLKDTIEMLEKERTTSLGQLSAEMDKLRSEAETEIRDKRTQLEQEQEDFRKEKEALQQKEKELKERELRIQIEEDRQAQEKAFMAEKLRIDEEKFRKIAEETILAETEAAKAVKAANEQLSQELTSLRMKYEEQKNINNRFKDKSPEEIYDMIRHLEEENDRLKTEKKALARR